MKDVPKVNLNSSSYLLKEKYFGIKNSGIANPFCTPIVIHVTY